MDCYIHWAYMCMLSSWCNVSISKFSSGAVVLWWYTYTCSRVLLMWSQEPQPSNDPTSQSSTQSGGRWRQMLEHRHIDAPWSFSVSVVQWTEVTGKGHMMCLVSYWPNCTSSLRSRVLHKSLPHLPGTSAVFHISEKLFCFFSLEKKKKILMIIRTNSS